MLKNQIIFDCSSCCLWKIKLCNYTKTSNNKLQMLNVFLEFWAIKQKYFKQNCQQYNQILQILVWASSINYPSMISQSYQHKKGPPKLIKDLKFGANTHLRQSLLDITQIQNLNKIFLGRKTYYSIEQIKKDPSENEKMKNENEETDFCKEEFVLSPQQNLQLIKKQLIANKMKDKLSQMFHQQQIRKYKLRKPVIHKMLSQFKSSFRVEDQPKYKQALKNSEKQLEHTKINSKKRASSQCIRTNTQFSRSKFLSAKTSKPIVNKNYFPTFRDFVQGKYKIKEKPMVVIDIQKINNLFDSMITQTIITESNFNNYTQNPSNKKKHLLREDYLKQACRLSPALQLNKVQAQSSSFEKGLEESEWLSICSRCIEPKKKNQQTLYQSKKDTLNNRPMTVLGKNRIMRAKSAINPNLSLNKSQKSSKNIISSMHTYYNVKKQKNQECDTIVEYMKKDRPLTSCLRRKNYSVIGNKQIHELDQYRQKTEEERVKILKKNYDFYISLLKIFEHCQEDEILFSIEILKRLKKFFECEYYLFLEDVDKICKPEKGQKTDFGVNIIRQNLREYAKKQANYNVQNQEQYQIL